MQWPWAPVCKPGSDVFVDCFPFGLTLGKEVSAQLLFFSSHSVFEKLSKWAVHDRQVHLCNPKRPVPFFHSILYCLCTPQQPALSCYSQLIEFEETLLMETLLSPCLIVRYKTLTFFWKFSQWITSHWNTRSNIFTARALQSPIWNDPAKHMTKAPNSINHSVIDCIPETNTPVNFPSNCWNTLKCVLMVTVMCSVENGRELLPFPEKGMVWTSSH